MRTQIFRTVSFPRFVLGFVAWLCGLWGVSHSIILKSQSFLSSFPFWPLSQKVTHPSQLLWSHLGQDCCEWLESGHSLTGEGNQAKPITGLLACVRETQTALETEPWKTTTAQDSVWVMRFWSIQTVLVYWNFLVVFFSSLQGIYYWSSQKIAKDLMTVISTILIFLDGGPQWFF